MTIDELSIHDLQFSEEFGMITINHTIVSTVSFQLHQKSTNEYLYKDQPKTASLVGLLFRLEGKRIRVVIEKS